MKLTFPKKQSYHRTIYHYDDNYMQHLNDNLARVPWSSVLSNIEDIDELTETFTTILQDEIKTCIPSKNVLIRPNDKPGMTGQVRSLFRKCHRLHKIAVKSRLVSDIENHKTARHEAKTEWKKAQKSYYDKLFKKLDTSDSKNKIYWKITKSMFGQNKTQSIPTIFDNGAAYTDDINKAVIFNKFFVSQTQNESSDDSGFDINQTLATGASPSFDSITIDTGKIYDTLKSLKVDKACGPDGIGNKILNTCANNLVEPLQLIFQRSYNAGCFPSQWKKVNVIPIFKKNDKSLLSNYRPIALLSCVSKVVERQVYNELYDFCQQHHLLSDKNSGFKKNVGTINQLINLVNMIYQGLDDREEIAMIFLDLSKAYDKVCHKRLLYKLDKLGIKGKLFDWFRSYLSGRSQRVVLSGQASDYMNSFGSLPQGSILAPLLFLIFLNDIENDIQSNISLFCR
jgi:hypothetical protein